MPYWSRGEVGVLRLELEDQDKCQASWNSINIYIDIDIDLDIDVYIIKYLSLGEICVGCFFGVGFWKVLSVATANVREKITWEELLAPCIKAVTHLKSAGLFACVCIALPCV